MKRRNYEIKEEILDALELYPKNSSQLAKKVSTSQQTIKKHLRELEDLHVVRKITTKIRGEEKEVWELVNGKKDWR